METPTLPVRYTDLEQQRFIDQWKQSGKSKASFCREYELSYFSFNDWIKRRYKKEQKQKSSFVPLELKNSDESVFIQLILKNGATVNIYHRVDATYLATLINA